MQTFLPYADFAQSAKCLDRRRLGKQRVEVLQLLKALLQGGGWVNHPAAKMWKGYEGALCGYGMAVCCEWISRGYADTCLGKMDAMFPYGWSELMPPWIGNEAFHRSHQSNLLRKDPVWYGKFGWDVPNDLPYVWPSKEL